MNIDKLNIIKNKDGFIAALDQSGGSSGKTLKLYGIFEDSYKNDEEMFNLIHDMRTRVIKSKSFTNDKIIGVILFLETINRKIDNKFTSDYLWEEKNIVSFLKIDKGLMEESDGVQLMKDIPDLEEVLDNAVNKNIFGTKMRSVIKSANEEGIEKVVKQQFDIAKIICAKGLVPIIEPEVSIDAIDKIECERILKEKIDIEFVSANPTGILHLGTARGAAYGSNLANIMSFAGYDVTKEYYINDAGNQIINLGVSLKERYKGLCGLEENMPEDGYYGS